jgi:hydrogen peroxide-dependent heme synthase
MSDATPAPVGPATGLGVLHLFCKPTPMFDGEAVIAAVKAAEAAGCQVVTVAMLGHKSDVGVMAIHRDTRELRALQTGLQHAGLDVVDSYVSITEVSEYAKGMPAEMQRLRLYPNIPPRFTDGPHAGTVMDAWCFYPMSKTRAGHANWYTLPYEQRNALMLEHGTSGRKYAGRVVQYITGSTGLDDYEWGVTLFGVHTDDLKDVVYTLRFDVASSVYAEFGPFYTGIVTPVEELVRAV